MESDRPDGTHSEDPSARQHAQCGGSTPPFFFLVVSCTIAIAKILPSLKRLDLSGNRLDSLSKISKWKGCFKYLEELHLAGNAVTSQSDYVAELLTWFPSLQNLDGQVDSNTYTTYRAPIPGRLPQTLTTTP